MPLSETRKWILFGGLAVLLSVGGIVALLGPGVRFALDRTIDALPADTEQRLGLERLDSALIASAAQSPELDALLARLAARLQAPDDRGPYRILIQPDITVNAFATPSGTLVLHTGLTRVLRDESELFGVLGHEAGHVRHRHGLKSVVRAAGTFVVVSIVAGDVSGIAGVAANASAELWQRGYGRRLEEQADDEGLATLERLALDPSGMVRLLETLESQADADLPDFLSTHPSPSNRRERLRSRAAPKPAAASAPTLSDRDWALLRQLP